MTQAISPLRSRVLPLAFVAVAIAAVLFVVLVLPRLGGGSHNGHGAAEPAPSSTKDQDRPDAGLSLAVGGVMIVGWGTAVGTSLRRSRRRSAAVRDLAP